MVRIEKNKEKHISSRRRKGVRWMFVWGCLLMAVQIFAQDFQNDLRIIRTLTRQGRWQDARQILEPVQKQYPDVQILYLELKQIYIQMNDLDAALSLSAAYLKNHPDDPAAKTEYGEALHRTGKTGEAMKVWEEVIRSAPDDPMMYHIVCNAMQNVQRYQKAAEFYLRGRSRLRQETLFALNLANLYQSAQEYGKAAGELLLHFLAYPKQLPVVQSTINRFPRSERIDKEVTDAIRQMIKQHPGHEGFLRLLSWQLLRQNAFEEALDVMLALDRKQAEENRGANLFFLANEAFRQKQYNTAAQAYQTILSNFPNSSFNDQVVFGWAQAESSTGQFQQAVHHYEEAVRVSRNLQLIDQARFQKALLLRDSLSLIPEALQGFTECYEGSRDPDVREKALIEMGECDIILGNPERAEEHWRKVVESRKNKRDALWLEALFKVSELKAMEGDFKTCLDQLSELKGYRSNSEGFSLDRMNDALDLQLLIQSHMKKDSTSLRLFMKSQRYYKQRKWMEGISTLDKIVLDFSKSGLADEALLFQADIYREIKQPERSLASLDTLLSRYPNSVLAERALYDSAAILESMKKMNQALSNYERLLIDYPDGIYSRRARERIMAIGKGDNL